MRPQDDSVFLPSRLPAALQRPQRKLRLLVKAEGPTKVWRLTRAVTRL